MAAPIDLEAIAAALHQGWMDCEHAHGVVYGPERTATTHPHYLPWPSLDTDSQNQDRYIAAVLLHDWQRGELAVADFPAAIHDAWAEWSRLQGENHRHARPYAEAHRDGDDEHTRQAVRVALLLGLTPASHNG